MWRMSVAKSANACSDVRYPRYLGLWNERNRRLETVLLNWSSSRLKILVRIWKLRLLQFDASCIDRFVTEKNLSSDTNLTASGLKTFKFLSYANTMTNHTNNHTNKLTNERTDGGQTDKKTKQNKTNKTKKTSKLTYWSQIITTQTDVDGDSMVVLVMTARIVVMMKIRYFAYDGKDVVDVWCCWCWWR